MKWVVMGSALLLMAIYLFLNGHKLAVLATQWADFNAGPTAPVASIKLAEETVYQHRLKTSDIFDATGNRQIVIMPVPREIFEKIGEHPEKARLIIEQQDVPLTSSADKSALLAITKERKIYLVADDTLKPMMTVIWNEQRRIKNFIQCKSPELCDSLQFSSRDWGPVEGPYSDSDFSARRRGMPRGRWARGPKTLLGIQSGIRQKVRLQINLLAVHPDQEISFRGSASQVRKVDTKSSFLSIGGRTLFLAVYVVVLDLQAGANGLEMNYSIWDKPVNEGANPLAAYITAIGVENMSSPAPVSDQGL